MILVVSVHPRPRLLLGSDPCLDLGYGIPVGGRRTARGSRLGMFRLVWGFLCGVSRGFGGGAGCVDESGGEGRAKRRMKKGGFGAESVNRRDILTRSSDSFRRWDGPRTRIV